MSIPERLAAALADRYRLERELGQGGMATVYLAEDLKHDRQVAIKVLRPELAAVLGAERFVVEIKTTAALQHPHILPLFDSGSADGFLYYVMPYIEGETLRTKLDREKQFGIDEAVKITREVADALDYAHRQGVIHRDIKPENILLHDGRPMVADFGIALAVSAAAGGRMTETGLSLGTPHYMSPEQATAEKEITARSDVYSLASVLYEMLAGDPPHSGGSAQQIIMKIVTEEAAPVTKMRRAVPPNVAAAVARALEKLPADRFESARAFAEALADRGFRNVTGPQASPHADRRTNRLTALLGAVAVLATALAAWGWLRPAPFVTSQFVVGFIAGQAPSLPLQGTSMAVSRDGSILVYTGGDSVSTRLWLKSRDELTAIPIPGTEGAYNPFISPDGRQVGFFTDQEGRVMKAVQLSGGLPRTVVGSPLGISGADWAADGYIYFDASELGLQRVRPDGSGREAVMPLDSLRSESGVAWPHVLPGDRVVIFRLRRTNDPPAEFSIVAQRIGTGEHREVARAVSATYAAGRLLFVTVDGTLQAAPFDEQALALTGPARAVASGLRIAGTYASADLAVTDRGTLYFVSGASGAASELQWVTRDGTARPVDPAWQERGEIRAVALSPDGTRAALELSRPGTTGTDIWVKQLPTGPLTRLTLDPAPDGRPSWSADGRSILFISERVRPQSVFRRAADGSGTAQLMAQGDRDISESIETPDGRDLIVRTFPADERAGDILALRIGADSGWRPILDSPAHESNPALSPDGRWLAFVSTASGRREVYVRPYAAVNGGVWQVSTEGGVEPQWAHSGKEIFFRAISTANLMAVDISTTPVFSAGTPHPLFQASSATGFDYIRYAVAPDDQRFLMVGQTSKAQPQLVRIENFVQSLKRRAAP